ncbi:MAG: hypothetical protein QG594_1517 [Bacteroidota bacterium]|nr:hypothetical protein [Bacteroidota bacterium]
MKKRTLFLIFFTVLLGCSIQAQNADIETIINKAALQRALTQRMAKNYMLIGMGINVEEATKELDKATTAFNENLHEIIFLTKQKNPNKQQAKSMNFGQDLEFL